MDLHAWRLIGIINIFLLLHVCTCMIDRPSLRASWPVRASGVPTAQTAAVGCDSSVGAQPKSSPDSRLANKQSPWARYECKHTSRGKEKGQGSALPAAQRSRWPDFVCMVTSMRTPVIHAQLGVHERPNHGGFGSQGMSKYCVRMWGEGVGSGVIITIMCLEAKTKNKSGR